MAIEARAGGVPRRIDHDRGAVERVESASRAERSMRDRALGGNQFKMANLGILS
jgi:hypothetical protein